MSTEQQLQLNVNIKEEMMDNLVTLNNMTVTGKLFAIKEESDDKELSTFDSNQSASLSILVKRELETCQCTGPDCLDCIEEDRSKETIGDASSTFGSLSGDDSDSGPSDWLGGESSDSDEKKADEPVAVSAASASNIPIKTEPLPEDAESLSPFASDQPASPSIVIKGETCPCTGNCLDCLPKRSSPCPQCGKTFSRNSQLKIHQRVHTGERPYVCDLCPKAFTQLGHLQRHQLTHQAVRSKPFLCTAEGCGKTFKTRTELTIHIRKHTGERPYKCDSCGKAFTTSGYLTVHLQSRPGNKAYKCNICNKSFTTSSNLARHHRSHMGKRPYRCDHCSKTFTSKQNLTLHHRLHTGERPYQCPLCPKAFTDLSYAKRHQRTAHPTAPWNDQM